MYVRLTIIDDFMDADFYHRENCRSCGSTELVKFLDLGKMPMANAFLRREEFSSEKKFPLAVYFCKKCCLVQILDVVNPEIIFKNYFYMTSASKPLADHFVEMANELADIFVKSPEDLVVEIGSNDGVLLEAIKNRCKILGVEPAENLAAIAEKKGVRTIKDFFSSELAKRIVSEEGEAAVVVANNVMAHIDDMNDVFRGVKKLIGERGVFVFEVHWVANLVGDGGFDQIYHEHLCYWSLHALKNFVESFGLKIFDAKIIPIHGESLRVFVSLGRNESISVAEILSKEKSLGLDKAEAFLNFSKKVEKNKNDLLVLLQEIKSGGKRIIAYGAPGKGNTLLNYFGIGKDAIDYVIDSTPLKQGLYMPGTHIQIFSPEKFHSDNPDYALLLAWNYADAILKKEEAFRKAGGKFIIPVPQVKIV